MTSRDSTDSNTVEANGIRIEISEPDMIVLPIPENRPSASALWPIHICITNNRTSPFRFNLYGTWTPELIAPERQPLQGKVVTDEQRSENETNISLGPGLAARFANLISSLARSLRQINRSHNNYLWISPGTSAGLSLEAKLFWYNDLLCLKFPTCYFRFINANTYWYFDAIQPITYHLRFIYDTNLETLPGAESDAIEIRTVQEMELNNLATSFVNLRLVQPVESDRSVVEVDGIRFETLVPERVLSVPVKKPGVHTPVRLGIGITNNTSTPLCFCLYATLIPELMKANGQIIRSAYLSHAFFDPEESDFISAMPGESISFFPDSKVLWLKGDMFRIIISAGDGGFWLFDELRVGTYQMRFIYKKCESRETTTDGWKTLTSDLSGRVWSGRVDTTFVEFSLFQP